METMTIEKSATSENVKFDEAQFLSVANQYGSDKKVKRVVDALIGSGVDNIDDTVAKAHVIIGALQGMVDNASGYTPDKDLDFGSDNGAVIAEKILGLSNSAGHVRKTFSGLAR